MFHLAAYRGALTGATNEAVGGVQDDVLTRAQSTNNYVLDTPMTLVAAYAQSLVMTRARLNSPTLRMISPPHIRPVRQAALPAGGELVQWFGNQPLALKANEEIGVEATGDNADVATILLWLTTGLMPIPAGPIITQRWTSSTAAVSGVWTSITMTLEQSLPPGDYALVGSECLSTNAIAHRWIIPNQFWRPGVLSQAGVTVQTDIRLQTRQLGRFGQFKNTAMPTCQVLVNGTDNSHIGFWQIVPLFPFGGF